MVQLMLTELKPKRTLVKEFSSKDKLESFLEQCCPNYEANPERGIKYRVNGATYDTKSEFSLIEPYLFNKKDDQGI